MIAALNVGSGQRRFTSTQEIEWLNCDIVSRPGEVADDLFDAREPWPFIDGAVSIVVLHHVLEHFLLHDADKVLREAHRVLSPGGSLLIFVPDIKALAIRWLTGGIDDFIYIVNLMGAWHGEDGDSHRWHFTAKSLQQTLRNLGDWQRIESFNWREVPGASLAKDFWVLAVEAVK